MRSNYWTCSKFADWLRGTAKPHAETSKGWRVWKNLAKSSHPVRYWIAEEGLDYLQNIWCFIPDKLNDIRYYINNRWISRSHSLTAHRRDIKPGDWCDVGNRFLPCLFNELVDFVEIEQAWHHCMWSDEADKKYNRPSRTFRWFVSRQWRCPEAGMDHLIWASTLVDDNNEPTHQAKTAKEIIDLYVWWTSIRPQRLDPHDASGWSAICARRREDNDDDIFGGMEDETPEQKAETRKALDRSQEMEAQHEQEDEDMMIRLIKIRQGLWT